MRAPKRWLITDTHFHHEMLVRENHRPFNHMELMIQDWKIKVRPQDVVIHLGDVILGKNGTLGNILSNLPGTKFLVRGNHDHESDFWYMRNGFAFVGQGLLHAGVWMTHMFQRTLPDGAILNIHGHNHDMKLPDDYPNHCKLLAMEFTKYQLVDFYEFANIDAIRRKLLEGDEKGLFQ